MDSSLKRLERARTYVNENPDLKRSLGLDANVVLSLRSLGKGEHNENYVFSDPESGRSFVLRINVLPQPFHDNQVRYEYDALRLLEKSGRVPHVFYIDDSANKPENGALVISYCEGDVLDFDNLRPGDLRCAVQIMADIHSEQVQANCSLYRPVDPLRELYDECIGRYEYYLASGFEEPRITRWMERYIKATSPALDAPFYPDDCCHVINTETLSSHFLIPEQSAVKAASTSESGTGRYIENPGFFVDWERPIIGEVAQDLAFFVAPSTTYWDSEFMFPRKNIEAFLNDYWRAVDGRFTCEAFEDRFWAYFKLSVFRSAMWCCKAIARYSAMSDGYKTEKTLGKLPIYLSDEFNERIFEECFD